MAYLTDRFVNADRDRSNVFPYADGSRFRGKTHDEIFSAIAEGHFWSGSESISGSGSSPTQTASLVRGLPGIFRKLGIASLLDIPCGDFSWMSRVPLRDVRYTGADIVEKIIDANNTRHGRANMRFVRLNILCDPLPASDMIFCRDCLVHFSISDILTALLNIRSSGSRYLMTTTFPAEEESKDIPTGGWRPINLIKPPFNFPEPVVLLNEECTEMNGLFADKSLGVWETGVVRPAQAI